MLLPVVAMPAAGFIQRIAATDMLNIPILMAAGAAVFNNLDFLFAIGVALGFAKTKDKGIPALVAFIGMNVLKEGLAIMDPEINMSIFGGIFTGLMAALVYNKFKDQKLPMVFSFFAGEKFPITMIIVVQLFWSVVFGYIWPVIQNGIDAFAAGLMGMGALGVFIFAVLNRLLIPFGLHHVINNYVYFMLGEYTMPNGDVVTGEITRFISGDPAAGAFLSGFFVTMMFGVPAIAFAIIRAAKKEKKEMVKGIMTSGAATSFVANITEPVEFSFMFTAPVLYVIHAIYAGLASVVLYFLDVRIGFTFGACIVDYILNFKIATNPILIIPVGIVFGLLYYFTFYFVITKKDLKIIGREDDVEFGEEVSESEKNLSLSHSNYEYMAKKILQYIGGKDNVEVAESCVTRLRLTLKDNSIIDEAKIKQTGAAGVIKIGDKDVQIVIGTKVTYVLKEFKKLIGE